MGNSKNKGRVRREVRGGRRPMHFRFLHWCCSLLFPSPFVWWPAPLTSSSPLGSHGSPVYDRRSRSAAARGRWSAAAICPPSPADPRCRAPSACPPPTCCGLDQFGRCYWNLSAGRLVAVEECTDWIWHEHLQSNRWEGHAQVPSRARRPNVPSPLRACQVINPRWSWGIKGEISLLFKSWLTVDILKSLKLSKFWIKNGMEMKCGTDYWIVIRLKAKEVREKAKVSKPYLLVLSSQWNIFNSILYEVYNFKYHNYCFIQ